MENSNHLKMYLLTKMVVFHCHVSFQGVNLGLGSFDGWSHAKVKSKQH